MMCGPLPLARGPFSFTRNRVNLFWSHALRAHNSLRERTFFLLLAWHTWAVFYQTYGPLPTTCGTFSFPWTFNMTRWDLCPSLADRLHSPRPRVDFSGHSRFACGLFSPRADLFLLLALHMWTAFYQTYGPLSAACGLFCSRGPFICYG